MAGRDANPDSGGCQPTIAPVSGQRTEPVVRRIVQSWRDLTGGRARGVDDRERRTLVACSGGADSSALAIALGHATKEFVVGHVVHDLRAPDAAERDRRASEELSGRLGVDFSSEHVRPGEAAGNDEANARKMRYSALESMARAHRCAYVATGHHAGDELETVLMGLIRGAGPRGLGGVRPWRSLSDSVTLIRPLLGISREETEGVCRSFGWTWVEDETNRDETRLRACIRGRVSPALECIRPGAAIRASRSAALIREAGEVVLESAEALLRCAREVNGGLAWSRESLRGRRGIVLGELLRLAIARVGGEEGLDRLGGVTLDAIVESLRDRGEERTFTLRTVIVRAEGGGLEVIPRG